MTEAGLKNNVAVAIQYLAAWLGGSGAVGLYNLMEDAATAEIARAQVWQWITHGVRLSDGKPVTAQLVERLIQEGLQEWGAHWPERDAAVDVFRSVALSSEWVDFLTLPAYDRLLAILH